MKKVAIRFRHPNLDQETLNRLAIDNTIVQYKKEPEMFDVVVDSSPQYEDFANKVQAETGTRPDWSVVYSVDIKDGIAVPA